MFTKTHQPVASPHSATELRWRNRPVHEMDVKLSDLAATSLEKVEKCQQDDRSKQRDQHGRNGKRIIDCPDVKNGAKEVIRQECAKDGYNNIDQQVRAIVHDFSGNPADYCSKDKVYKKVHFLSPIMNV
jgi:hypothetical protein